MRSRSSRIPETAVVTAPRRRFAAALAACVTAAALLGAGAVHAQTRPPLTQNDFNLDLVTGPVLGSGRIVGLGGAYTALAVGVEGASWNPAAYASRALWQNDWFEWNGTLNIIPSTIKNSDFDNNGESGFTYDNFVFGSVGLGLQFGEFGAGGLLNLQTYQIGNTTDLTLLTANYGVGYMFQDGQLVIGAGVRTVELTLDESGSGNSLVNFGGTMPEAGMVLRPADQPWRAGFAARLPVVSDSSNKVVAGGLTLPREIRMPWEIQAGMAWELGARPLNRKWINTHDLEKHMREEMLEQRRARARTQWQHERLAERMQMVQDRALPDVAELEPNPEIAGPEGMPHDATWWSEESTRRWDEERALLAHLAELADEREREVRALSRRYLLFSADAIAVGPTPQGVGLESFLSQQRQTSGRHTTFGFRFGIEGEPIAYWVQMRAGTYLEPSRFAGVGYRVHGTLGADVRLFSWDFFGLLDEFTLRAGAAADVAERYLNAGVGVGLWH
jgi:hypothetical protein